MSKDNVTLSVLTELFEAHLGPIKDDMREIKRTNNANADRIGALEKDVGGAKLLGKVALGVTMALGGLVTWATNIASKLPAIKGLTNN
jgi:hypothetical protein